MKWHLYQLDGWCPARSVDDLVDYACGNPEDFLDRFTIEQIPDDQLDENDLIYLRGLEEFEGGGDGQA